MKRIIKHYSIILLFSALLIGGAYHIKPYVQIAPAEAANGKDMSERASDPNSKIKTPVLVELFTSQGCYSCPAAEAYLRDLAVREDVIALEYHVDYWNDLSYGLAGKWKDPFSSARNTYRQSEYNREIREQNQNYTPQIVVNGRYETVGSNKSKVSALIRKARSDDNNNQHIKVTRDGNRLKANLNTPLSEDFELKFAIYRKRAVTDVTSGENKGKELASYNIVHTLGVFPKNQTSVEIPEIKDGDHCAVFVQNRKTLNVTATSLCRL